VKIGGEMISLGAVEMALAQAHSHNQTAGDAPSLALCADERIEGKPRLILFTTVPFLEEEIATILRNKGFSRLIKISKVIQIPEIPLMGTGKTNYRQLQTMIQ
jgi:long-chain-fatty-acid--[acyl-carrier-protein] ligase